jgi:hypothetical protein
MQRVSLSKQNMELAWGKGKSRDILGWPPGEPAFGKSFGHKPKTGSIKDQDFYSCPEFVCKDKEGSLKRIFVQSLLT